ncbi:copper resistance protein CopD [Sphaerisporangium krabiense]|uniref:Putative copper resistance protein D n=1 Tax=Sphaerisporangium krabiense TaxID=763782 RepID=A0A7W8ZAB3_9ACTN|nr:CopD family protein [Sphaerisporangium krabiense]MBB5630319.1 putative copper resistance protein D [Sphaerisporangium krabiense]GII62730.1 copper resistance protein CopD [Sphaerisporangium krabiense]
MSTTGAAQDPSPATGAMQDHSPASAAMRDPSPATAAAQGPSSVTATHDAGPAADDSPVTVPPAPVEVRWGPVRAIAGAGLVAVLVAAWWTAEAGVPGIAAPGPFVEYGLPVARLVMDLCALATVGLSLLPRLVGFDEPGRAEAVLGRARSWAVMTAFGWALAALTTMILSAAEVTPGQAPDPATYVARIGAGQGLVISAAIALIYTFFALLAVRFGEKVPAELRVAIALFGLLPLPVSGHASNWYWHDLSMVSMELHVAGAALWTGGLVTLAVLLARDRDLLARALPRFSRLATVALLVVGLSGLFNGLVELALSPTTSLPWSLVTTHYGWLVVAKTVFACVIAVLGARIRWRLLPAVAERRATAFAAWAVLEITVMGLAYGVAVALTRAPVA